MNITDYLLLPEQAKWAKEKGFDGECNWFLRELSDEPVLSALWSNFTLNFPGSYATIPTFDQFFDWVEEKWGLFAGVSTNGEEWAAKIKNPVNLIFWANTKRSARIAAVEAIIKYVEENKL